MKWPQEPRMPGLMVIFSVDRHLWGSAVCQAAAGIPGEPDRCGHMLGECLRVYHAALTRGWAGQGRPPEERAGPDSVRGRVRGGCSRCGA